MKHRKKLKIILEVSVKTIEFFFILFFFFLNQQTISKR